MKLYAHQKKVIDDDPTKCGLFLGTGSGKTRIALELARGTCLVIAPKTQVEDQNWQRELDNVWNKGIVFDRQSGTITVISKETFRRDHEKLPRFDTVIVDEAHTCLGVTPNVRWRKREAIPKTSQLFEALDSFVKRTKPERIYLCTATIMRSPMTVWAAAKILGKKIDWFKFREKFYIRLPMPFREVYSPRSSGKVKDALAKLVHSLGYVGRLDDFFDVPEQTWRTQYVELTEKQRARIESLKTEYPDPLVYVGKRHQVENGVLSGDEYTAPEFFDDPKIEKILDYAIEFPRMVIFAKYRLQIAQIEKALKKAGKKVYTLTGETKDRGGVIAAAAKEKECVFVAQAQVSAGWELKEYPVMIFASRTNSFVDFEQAKGRIQRADNIKKNLYIKLIAKPYRVGKKIINTVDDAQDFSLENKQDFDERLYAKQ